MASLVLNAMTDADPCPRVGLTITGVTGTQQVTVWRTAGGQRLKVRGLSARPITSADYVVDYEAPLGRPITYEMYLGDVLDDTETITLASTTAWLQDPLAPTQSSPLLLKTGPGAAVAGAALTEFTYAMPGQIVDILGGAPVALGSARRPAAAVPFDLFTNTAEATSRIRSILTQAFPVLVRPLPIMDPLPPVAFLSVTAVTERPTNTYIGGTLTRWALTGDLVAGPSVSIVVPVWTYADVSALWTTYGTVKSGQTYLDWLKDPEP